MAFYRTVISKQYVIHKTIFFFQRTQLIFYQRLSCRIVFCSRTKYLFVIPWLLTFSKSSLFLITSLKGNIRKPGSPFENVYFSFLLVMSSNLEQAFLKTSYCFWPTLSNCGFRARMLNNLDIFKNGRVTRVRHNKILSVLWLKILKV